MTRLLWIGCAAALFGGCSRKPADDVYKPLPRGTLTYSKHIAPIIFEHCATCHRPGQAAPFSLLTYADVKKRTQQIAEVTAKRYMPPWMPDPGYADFVGERRLTAKQLGMLQQWVAEGGPEGNPADLPPKPQWTEGWQLGKPDLIVTMPEPYTVPAEGADVYRNFVVPIPLDQARYVRAMEFHPGNWKVVHHAFMRFDRAGDSRRQDALDAEVGFSGIHTPPGAQAPAGHFVSWQPGKVFSEVHPGLSWQLEPKTDLVLQLHLQPSGKPEQLQASVGFYFTEQPPTNTPTKLSLSAYDIDIPAGASNHVVTDSVTVAADVDLLGILPHAHYIGKEVESIATLPDGSKKWLLKISRWDFDWQGDYRYREPIFLPKGTTLSMKFVYDNSDENVANPNHPPKRVRYGLQSTDAMGEIWFQVLPRNSQDAEALRAANQSRVVKDMIAYSEYLLRQNPKDPKAYIGLAKATYFMQQNERALNYLQTALRLDPNLDEAHYYLGLVWRRQNRLDQAKAAFLNALRLNPQNAKAAGNLGFIFYAEGNLAEAEAHLSHALSLDPEDALARRYLDEIARRAK
jgi:hypothetical protein